MESEASTFEVIDYFKKSQNDRKQYRSIRLANGMKVMLIQDDSVQESVFHHEWPACALTVSVGSLSDPDDLPGLAKYVARMMYHSDNDFIQFISYDGPEASSKNCTSRNRYRAKINSLEEIVDDNQTTFSFVSRINTLDEALTRYAKLLKMPFNMRDSMTQYRKKIVENFDAQSCNDAENKLLSLLGNPGHPSRNFAWGNMKALNESMDDDTLYRRIEEFKNRHYSAHRMSLCLHTPLTLDAMQEMVLKLFSSIPSNHLPALDFSSFTHENAFQSDFHENVYFARGEDNTAKLQITWCVPPLSLRNKTQTYQFLQYVMDTDCEGSLRNYLKEKNWANTDNRYNRIPVLKTNSIFSLFMLQFRLYEDGMKHLDDVIEVVFSYFRLNLQQLKQRELLEPLYRDFVNARNLPRYSKLLPQDSAMQFAQALMNDPLTDQLSYECDETEIYEAIDTLNKRNLNIIVISRQKYDETIEFESKDENCRIEYTHRKMPDKWVSFWNNPEIFPELSLPSPNPYIADDFTILYDGSQAVPKYPVKVYENDMSELWYRLDDKLSLPTAHCVMYFKTTSAFTPAQNIIFTSMLVKILSSRTHNRLHYYREQARVRVHFLKVDGGLEIKIWGPNQKLYSVIDDMTKELTNLSETMTDDEFDDALEDELHPHAFLEFAEQQYYTGDLLKSIIQTEHVTYHDLYRCAKQIQYEDMQHFCRYFFKQAKILALIQGNLDEETAISIMQKVRINLGSEKVENQASHKPQILKLPEGTFHLLVPAWHHTQYQTATKTYYQVGEKTERTKLIIELLTSVNSNPRLNQLSKTFLKNCYFSWGLIEYGNVLGYTISVTSVEQSTPVDVVDKRIKEVRDEMILMLENMSAEEFQEHLSIFKQKYEITYAPDNNLMGEVDQNWPEIKNGEHLFDRYTHMLQMISSMEQSEVIQFYREHRAAPERAVSIKVIGYTKETGLMETGYHDRPEFPVPDETVYAQSDKLDSDKQIKNIDEFKKSLDTYKC